MEHPYNEKMMGRLHVSVNDFLFKVAHEKHSKWTTNI
jgi:hypothetical protein